MKKTLRNLAIIGATFLLLSGCATGRKTAAKPNSNEEQADENDGRPWRSFAIGEFIFDRPSAWKPGKVQKDLADKILGVTVPFYNSEGKPVGDIHCPIIESELEANQFKKQSRTYTSKEKSYGADLWVATTGDAAKFKTVLVLLHRGDIAHWKDNDGAKHSCELRITNVDQTVMELLQHIYESVR